jgi:hypothetical protein
MQNAAEGHETEVRYLVPVMLMGADHVRGESAAADGVAEAAAASNRGAITRPQTSIPAVANTVLARSNCLLHKDTVIPP